MRRPCGLQEEKGGDSAQTCSQAIGGGLEGARCFPIGSISDCRTDSNPLGGGGRHPASVNGEILCREPVVRCREHPGRRLDELQGDPLAWAPVPQARVSRALGDDQA